MALVEGTGRGLYRWSCPNCKGPNTESRLAKGLPCPECLPKVAESDLDLESLVKVLERLGTLKNLKELYELEKEVKNLEEFFKTCVGAPPWGIQRTWIKRFVRGDSFSIVAPTGTGKTTFGLILALYSAYFKNEKTYIIAPTSTLVAQIAEKLETMMRKSSIERVRVVYIHSKMKEALKREALKKIEEGDFDILITTIAYARKNLESLKKNKFKLIFVDDVDAVMKSGRTVKAVLKIAGFSDEDVSEGFKLLQLEREIARLAEALPEKSKEKQNEIQAKINQLQQERDDLRKKLQEKRRQVAILIVSSATGRPRGASRIFRALLGFDVGGRSDIGLRNIIDSYLIPKEDVIEETVKVVKRLGKGTLVFVPNDWGIEKAEEVARRLEEAGVRAKAYHSKTSFEVFREFQRGELDVLVGVANYYGPLVRGVDLPEVVRHAVFAGVPRYKFSLMADEIDPHPLALARIAELIAELEMPELSERARRILVNLRRIIRRYTPSYLQYLLDKIRSGVFDESERSISIIIEAREFIREALRNEEVLRRIRDKTDVGLVIENGKTFILIADVPTYLQASGRTSRLYVGGITKGLSVVIVDSPSVFRRLVSRSHYVADVDFVDFRELNIDEVLKEIEQDRINVSRILKGEAKAERKDLVRTSLLVVESPNKARTIASFFGRPSVRVLHGGLRAFEVSLQNRILIVAASGGHVQDLVLSTDERDLIVLSSLLKNYDDIFGVVVGKDDTKEVYVPIYSSIKRCLACGEQFVEDLGRCPRCGSKVFRDSKEVIEDLRRLAWEVDEVLIGTDPDTEGEKIGWDIAVLLKPFNKNIKRLEFHEVTKQAILKALENPRDFNEKLVEAQIVRRVEDRWIGFTLSPLLWCDFWPKHYCAKRQDEACSEEYNYNLSAGRVQTPVLGWVVARTNEYKKKVDVFTFLKHDTKERLFSVREHELKKPSILSDLKSYARAYARGKEQLLELKVISVERKWITLYPQPPFMTDTLILEAGRRLAFGASETMRLAQDLFEWGLITYHRTDSTRVSERGIEVAKEWLKQTYGDQVEEVFRPRRWSEGGAHEAIRPVKPLDAKTLRLLIEEGSIEVPGVFTQRHYRLYDLIFRRFVASQMREAEVLEVTYSIDIIGDEYKVTRIVELPQDRIRQGFLAVFPEVVALQRPLVPKEEEEALISRQKDKVFIACYVARRRVPAVRLFTQGELVEEMKRKDIGRPSTYAKIVDTLLKRGYILSLKSGHVVATSKGEEVYEYLMNLPHNANERLGDVAKVIPELVSEERTRQLEKAMDEIESGTKTWREVLEEVYKEVRGLVHIIKSASKGEVEESGIIRTLAECMLKREQLLKRGVANEG
ncbi:MAG: reverse gyrase [Acidilobaceae archaeon]